MVFGSSRDDGGLYWKAADGTGQVERLKEGLVRPHAWTADGRLIFDQKTGGDGDIGVLTMEGERTVEMLLDAEFEEVVPALSPDGRWLAYVTRETGPLSIYVKPFPNVDDGLWNVSLDQQAVNPVWSPDGRALYYRVGARGNTLMVSQIETEPTFSHGTPELVFSLSGYRVGFGRDVGGPWDIALDGRFLFPTSGTVEETDDEPFNGLIYVENWFEELKERVPVN